MTLRALLAAALLLHTACQSLGPRVGPDVGDARPDEWMRALVARSEDRRALRASARLVLDAPDLRLRRPQRFVASRPANLRIEILGLFDQVAAVLITENGRYALFDPASGAVERGDVTRDLLWRVARVDLSPEEAVDLLLGAPVPPPEWLAAPAASLDGGGASVGFLDATGVVRRRYEFDGAGRLLRLAKRDALGDLVWRAHFEDYRELAGGPFAFEIELEFPRLEARAVLRMRQAELNPALAPGIFELELPRARGADVRVADGGA